jgi:hypothetical protein
LPDPQAGSFDDRTVFQAESAFRKNKKGSALADDTEIMMPLPVREGGPLNNKGNGAETLPWLTSFVERVKVRWFIFAQNSTPPKICGGVFSFFCLQVFCGLFQVG